MFFEYFYSLPPSQQVWTICGAWTHWLLIFFSGKLFKKQLRCILGRPQGKKIEKYGCICRKMNFLRDFTPIDRMDRFVIFFECHTLLRAKSPVFTDVVFGLTIGGQTDPRRRTFRKTVPNDICRKNRITNDDNNIIQLRGMSVILLIFMSDIYFRYMSNEGCFSFIVHHFLLFMGEINPYLKRECERRLSYAGARMSLNIKTSIFNLPFLSYICMDFYAVNMRRSPVKMPFQWYRVRNLKFTTHLKFATWWKTKKINSWGEICWMYSKRRLFELKNNNFKTKHFLHQIN